ncbi:hypothetical protein D3C76_1411390 [compost metagenome]
MNTEQSALPIQPYHRAARTDNQHTCVVGQQHMAVQRLVTAHLEGLPRLAEVVGDKDIATHAIGHPAFGAQAHHAKQ